MQANARMIEGRFQGRILGTPFVLQHSTRTLRKAGVEHRWSEVVNSGGGGVGGGARFELLIC